MILMGDSLNFTQDSRAASARWGFDQWAGMERPQLTREEAMRATPPRTKLPTDPRMATTVHATSLEETGSTADACWCCNFTVVVWRGG